MEPLNSRGRSRWTAWLLAVSMCVNAGVIVAVVSHWVRTSVVPSSAARRPVSAASSAATVLVETESRPELVRRLGLNDEQRAQMTTMKRDLMTSTVVSHRKALDERLLLIALLKAPEIDQAAVQESLARIQKIQAETQQAVVAHIIAERRLLRPDQVEPFNALVLPRFFSLLGPSAVSKPLPGDLKPGKEEATTNPATKWETK
jgi:Spy/CpxP family protein refolding chaperone